MANTLLDLLSGGRYSTSEDLPTIPEMAHSYIDQIIDANERVQTQEPEVVGPGGLGMLEWAGTPAKAMAMAMRPGSTGVSEMVKQLSLQLAKLPKGDAYNTSYSLLEYLKKYQRLSKKKK